MGDDVKFLVIGELTLTLTLVVVGLIAITQGGSPDERAAAGWYFLAALVMGGVVVVTLFGWAAWSFTFDVRR